MRRSRESLKAICKRFPPARTIAAIALCWLFLGALPTSAAAREAEPSSTLQSAGLSAGWTFDNYIFADPTGRIAVFDQDMQFLHYLDENFPGVQALDLTLDGNLVAAGAFEVHKYDSAGNIVLSFGTQVEFPGDLKVDGNDDTLYLAAGDLNQGIIHFNGNGTPLRNLGVGTNYSGLALLSGTELVATSTDVSGFHIFDLGTGNLDQTLPFGDGQLSADSMRLSASGNTVLVIDQFVGSVFERDSTNLEFLREFAVPFTGYSLLGVTPAPMGGVRIAAFRNATDVFAFDSSGNLITTTDVSASVSAAGDIVWTGLGTTTAELSIDDVTVDEGTGGGPTLMTFTVTLNGAVPGGVTVDFQTLFTGTATVVEDFVDAFGTLHFAGNDGETQTFTIEVTADNTVELDEQVNVLLSNPVGATITKAIGTGTIGNDDSATVSINDVTTPEGDIGDTEVQLQITLSNPVEGTIRVYYKTQDITATTSDGDYIQLFENFVELGGPLGQTVPVTVSVVGDEKFEPDEDFALVLLGVDNFGLDVTLHTQENVGNVTIENDDPDPDVRVLNLSDLINADSTAYELVLWAIKLISGDEAGNSFVVETEYTCTGPTATAEFGCFGTTAAFKLGESGTPTGGGFNYDIELSPCQACESNDRADVVVTGSCTTSEGTTFAIEATGTQVSTSNEAEPCDKQCDRPHDRHLTTTIVGSFCGSGLTFGEGSDFVVNSRSRGTDIESAAGHYLSTPKDVFDDFVKTYMHYQVCDDRRSRAFNLLSTRCEPIRYDPNFPDRELCLEERACTGTFFTIEGETILEASCLDGPRAIATPP